MTTTPATSGLPAPVNFRAEAKALGADLTALRRDLHAHPEIGLDLPYTQKQVLEQLAGLPLIVHTGAALSSVIAVLEGGRPGPTVLLRGDMDALPVTEDTGLEYASTNGAMHACGHDLHISGLVGAARLLSAHREELPGRVVFMFQPGEEGDAGARVMLEEGMWETIGGKPDAAFGIHVWSGDRGRFETRAGTMMAGANRLHVTFHGKAGHASRPQDSINPNLPLIEFCSALQGMVTSGFSVFDPVVATITTLAGSSAINAIHPSATMGASVRTLSLATTKRFPELATRLAESVAEAYRCTAEVNWIEQYPPTINDDAEAVFALDTLRTAFGDAAVVDAPDPVMGSEDFSWVLEEVPGAFIFFYVSPDDVVAEEAATNHSPHVLFDDKYLPDQAAALATIAWERLAKG